MAIMKLFPCKTALGLAIFYSSACVKFARYLIEPNLTLCHSCQEISLRAQLLLRNHDNELELMNTHSLISYTYSRWPQVAKQ
jgi:hypothetical protein